MLMKIETPEEIIRRHLEDDANSDTLNDWDRGWFAAMLHVLILLKNQREHDENQDH
jgi:hypothetical protein